MEGSSKISHKWLAATRKYKMKRPLSKDVRIITPRMSGYPEIKRTQKLNNLGWTIKEGG